MSYKQQLDDAIQSVIDSVVRENYTKGVERGRFEERAEHAAKRDEKDALIKHLTARVATLEGALKAAAPYARRNIHDIWNEDAMQVEALIEIAIHAHPAVSLERIKAAELREIRRKIHHTQTWFQIADMITDEAERLESGATNENPSTNG